MRDLLGPTDHDMERTFMGRRPSGLSASNELKLWTTG
jgi:hypothetical protein